MNNKQYQHWQLKLDDHKILWAGFNRKGQNTNTIDNEVLNELDTILSSYDKSAKGLVIYSAKENGFIAGADVRYFSQFTTSAEFETFIRQGQMVFNKLAALAIPTVAMIDGFCMGGGLELSLACRYRVAEESAETRLGLPEVLLGIHPGWGGSVRLPRLIGPTQALPMMLRGEAIPAKKAAKIGLVDAAVPKRQLRHAAEYYINERPPVHRAPSWQRLFDVKFLRAPLASYMRKQLKARVDIEHYPAPYAIINNWEKASGSIAQELNAEVDSIIRLIEKNQTAKNLIRVFFLQERLKEFAKQNVVAPQHVHVVGAGIMGGDIAAWCALSGLKVTLQDVDLKRVAAAIARANELFKKKLRDPRLITAANDRLIPDIAGNGITQADIIIEAIVENLQAKQTLFKEIEQRAKPDAILATNTSSIPLDEINQTMINPARLVGIHFFNPVAKMKLVEVVQGKQTDVKILDRATAFIGKINHLPIPVKSCPGFLVNRILMPYLLEAVVLFEEGIPAVEIDKAATQFGMPIGPIELSDTIGLDTCLAAANVLTQHYGGTVPQTLKDKVAAGQLGRKSGQGFYRYHKGKAIKEQSTKETTSQPSQAPALNQIQMANRLIFRIINESIACLREGVVADADLLDAGMIFGTGFAPFRGGPMHYAHSLGEKNLTQQFAQLHQNYGERFKLEEVE